MLRDKPTPRPGRWPISSDKSLLTLQQEVRGVEIGRMRRAGSIHVITGCMFSGKTEELLRQLRRASVGGRSVLLIRPAADTRSSSEIAQSRSGTSFACTTVDTAQDIHDAVAASPCEVVAIDE